jgi:hypothetical protein
MKLSEICSTEKENRNRIYLYKEGSFWKAYERSAYLFVGHVREYQTKKRYIKNINMEVVSTGFPDSALSRITDGRTLVSQESGLVVMEIAATVCEADYAAWKNGCPLTVPPAVLLPVREEKPAGIEGKAGNMELLAGMIRSFPLAGSTLIECMQFVAKLQEHVQCDAISA